MSLYMPEFYSYTHVSEDHYGGIKWAWVTALAAPSQYPFSVFAKLNDHAPAWSFLIPGVLSPRAKEFSLYISGRCLQKSSDGIWQEACQHCAVGVCSTRKGSYTPCFLTVLSVAVSDT